MQRFYRLIDKNFESCFYVETSVPLTTKDLKAASWLLAETFEHKNFGHESFLERKQHFQLMLFPYAMHAG